MKRTAFIAFTLVTSCYLVIGAVVFHFIEGRNEENVKVDFAVIHDTFLRGHECITPEALYAYLSAVLETEGQGIKVMSFVPKNQTNLTLTLHYAKEDTNWDVASTFLFCLTVISTIGYGNIAPKTKGGQLFCIFYALCGIPLCATTLVGVGERLQIPLKKIKKGPVWCKSNPSRDSQLKTSIFLSTGILILIFIPSAVIANTEDWSFIEAFYFCIITLTTIGFGDYVPGRDENHHLSYVQRFVLAVWIMLGLSWIALILSEVASVLQDNIMRAARSTQSRLGDLEDIVRKKARETKDRLAQKDYDIALGIHVIAQHHGSMTLNGQTSSEKTATIKAEELQRPGLGEGDILSTTILHDVDNRHKLQETRISGNYSHLPKKASLENDTSNTLVVPEC